MSDKRGAALREAAWDVWKHESVGTYAWVVLGKAIAEYDHAMLAATGSPSKKTQSEAEIRSGYAPGPDGLARKVR